MSNSSDIPAAMTEGSSQPKRFRWRLVPALFLALFGGLLAVGYTVVWIIRLADSSGPTPDVHSLRTDTALLMISAGVLWVVSGLCFWKRRWWLAVACLIMGYALGGFGMWLYEKRPPRAAANSAIASRFQSKRPAGRVASLGR